MARAAWAAALLALVVAAGCTSSGKPAPKPVGASTAPQPAASSSAPPTTAAPPSSASPTPTTTTTKALSPYEADPGVQTLRAWADTAAKTINGGDYDGAALDALMTAKLRRSIKQILGNSVGYRYPGPLPFTPTRVDVAGSSARTIDACFVTNGYGIDPQTGKPHGKYRVTAIKAQVRRVNGQWLLDVFGLGSFSCKGVHIEGAVAQ